MGELPIFTCQAHVFTINPSTRKSWVAASSKAIEINFFYDSNKECYRIVSVDDSLGEKRVVINCTITERMVFKQTSQKFGQWAGHKSSGMFGLGFNSEIDLARFVSQFKQCVEATKQTSTGINKRNLKSGAPSDNNQVSPPKDVHPNSGSSSGDANSFGQFTSRSTLPLSPPPANFMSGFGPPAMSLGKSAVMNEIKSIPEPAHLQQQLFLAQTQIRVLEQELSAVKRHPLGDDVASVDHSSSRPIFDSTELQGGFDGVHLSDASPSITNNSSSSSRQTDSHVPSSLKKHGEFGMPDVADNPENGDHSSEHQLLALHRRLGNILQEATNLHLQIGRLLMHSPHASSNS